MSDVNDRYSKDAATSDGSTASYYKLPADSSELQHLISYKNMNAQLGEIFRACYRYGEVAHSEKLRDAKKIKFYIEAEIARLEAPDKELQHELPEHLTLDLSPEQQQDLKRRLALAKPGDVVPLVLTKEKLAWGLKKEQLGDNEPFDYTVPELTLTDCYMGPRNTYPPSMHRTIQEQLGLDLALAGEPKLEDLASWYLEDYYTKHKTLGDCPVQCLAKQPNPSNPLCLKCIRMQKKYDVRTYSIPTNCK